MRTATAFFITRALLTTWGRNIRPAPNRSPTTFMPAISGPSMTSSGRAAARRASSVSSTMKASMPATRAWVSRSSTGRSRQARSSAARSIPASPAYCAGQLEQALRGVGPAVQHDVLDPLAELGLDVVVDRQDAGVDDGHVEAGRDRVVEEDRVDRLAHPVVAAEGERDVRDAARCPRPGELDLQPADGLDERDRVGVVLLHPGRDREDVGVEDDVLGLEPDDLGQQVVGAPQDGDPPLDRLGLALLVEGHDHDRRAVAPAQAGLAEELRLALLERDRVDDALALELLEPGLDDRPFRAVDHDRHRRDVGLGGDPAQEAGHRRDAVEHRLVHVHVDQLGAVGDLLAGDVDRLVLGARRRSAGRTCASR